MQSITVVSLLLRAVERARTQEQVFDKDPYESRRTACQGEMLLKVLMVYALLKTRSQRGVVKTIGESQPLQAALGGTLTRSTLSNALQQRDLAEMIEAWQLVLTDYGPQVARLGKKFARIAAVDASLIKLSLAAFAWAQYRETSGAAKMHVVLEWARQIPQQFVFTDGKVADVRAAARMVWLEHWTYLFDRGYFSFLLLRQLRAAGAHFVLRFKDGVNYQIVERRAVPVAPRSAGLELCSDELVVLPGYDEEVLLRLVSYRLPDGKLIRVLTDRLELSAVSVAQLYKARWTIENWWRWIKRLYKVKEPLGRSEQALPVQIVAAFVTDLLLRVFERVGLFAGGLYQLVTSCQEQSLVAVRDLSPGSELRQALEAVQDWLAETEAQPTTVP
jgi:hypothetical protein